MEAYSFPLTLVIAAAAGATGLSFILITIIGVLLVRQQRLKKRNLLAASSSESLQSSTTVTSQDGSLHLEPESPYARLNRPQEENLQSPIDSLTSGELSPMSSPSHVANRSNWRSNISVNRTTNQNGVGMHMTTSLAYLGQEQRDFSSARKIHERQDGGEIAAMSDLDDGNQGRRDSMTPNRGYLTQIPGRIADRSQAQGVQSRTHRQQLLSSPTSGVTSVAFNSDRSMNAQNAAGRPGNQTYDIRMTSNAAYEGEEGTRLQGNQEGTDSMTVNRGYVRHIPPESNAIYRNAEQGRLSTTVTSELQTESHVSPSLGDASGLEQRHVGVRTGGSSPNPVVRDSADYETIGGSGGYTYIDPNHIPNALRRTEYEGVLQGD